MAILTERDVTPELAKQLRLDAGLTQHEFWDSVGSNQGSGHWYENGKRKQIQRPIRVLIFLRYVAGIPVGASTEKEAALAVKHGGAMAALINSDPEVQKAKAAAAKAKEQVTFARKEAKKAQDKIKVAREQVRESEKKAKELTKKACRVA